MKISSIPNISQNMRQRTSSGISITELLVGTLLLSGTLAVLAEFMSGLTIASAKMNNHFEAQTSLRYAIGRIKNDVRAARIIGDSYSIVPSTSFPGSGNWLYGTPPFGGWPVKWGPTPYQLDAQTLVLQVPALLSNPGNDGLNGFPLKIKSDTSVNGVIASAEFEDLDTIVYKLVPDETQKQVYTLQVAMFPGSYNQGKAINPPQTLVKGVIGPTNSANGGIPEVFSYISNTAAPQLVKSPTSPEQISGVRVDIEVKRPVNSTEGSVTFQKNASAHAEIFSRWNRM